MDNTVATSFEIHIVRDNCTLCCAWGLDSAWLSISLVWYLQTCSIGYTDLTIIGWFLLWDLLVLSGLGTHFDCCAERWHRSTVTVLVLDCMLASVFANLSLGILLIRLFLNLRLIRWPHISSIAFVLLQVSTLLELLWLCVASYFAVFSSSLAAISHHWRRLGFTRVWVC